MVKKEAANKINGNSTKAPAPKKKKVEESEEKKAIRKAYEKYLRSPRFKEVKEYVHRRDNETCQICHRTLEDCQKNGKIFLSVHHQDYTRIGLGLMGGEQDTTILLCSVCHNAISRCTGNLHRFADKHYIIENLKKADEWEKLEKVESNDTGETGVIIRKEGEGYIVHLESEGDTYLTEDDFTRIK